MSEYGSRASRHCTLRRLLRVFHGQFVNPRQCERENYATDLKKEHCIQDNKQSMRGMRGNKTLQAVQRSPSSYGQKEFCVHFDRDCDIPPDSTCHTRTCTTEDVTAMITIIQPTKLISFPHTFKSPVYNRVDISKTTVFLPYYTGVYVG